MIGKTLRILREKKGLTQAQLAALLHTTQETISNYEKDKFDPDTENLLKIADLFGVTVDALLGRTELICSSSADDLNNIERRNVKYYENIIQRIIYLRDLRGYSTNKLAVKAGLTQSTLQSIIKDKKIPSIPTLEKICTALGVSLSEFFADEGDQQAEQWLDNPTNKMPPVATVNSIFKSLDDRPLKESLEVLEIVQQLLSTDSKNLSAIKTVLALLKQTAQELNNGPDEQAATARGK